MQVFAQANAITGIIKLENHAFSCTLGRSGIVPAAQKTEGDGATPAGTYPLRAVYWRADRIAKPHTDLPTYAIQPDDGWCDAADDLAYNQLVKRPYPASHEEMWRDDHAYDVVVVIGYNDAPASPGKGSCIFMHLNHDDGRPTAGCIALDLPDLLTILALCNPQTLLTIEAV